MKIDPNLIIGAVAGKAAAGKASTTVGTGLFEDILKGVQSDGAPGAQAVGHVYRADAVSPQTMRCLSLSDQAVGTLEAYAKRLIDPGVSLKDIAPLVEDLGQLRTEMLDAGSFLSEGDPLKGIMNEVASTLNAEVVRFKRGDLSG